MNALVVVIPQSSTNGPQENFAACCGMLQANSWSVGHIGHIGRHRNYIHCRHAGVESAHFPSDPRDLKHLIYTWATGGNCQCSVRRWRVIP